jgi:hypothetical protein
MIELGATIWGLFFDQSARNFTTRQLGVVQLREATRFRCAGKWYQTAMLGQGFFTSEAAAMAWIAKHPHQAPTVSERVSK